MDAKRFDTLVKTFSTPETRRGLLRVVAGVPLAGALAALLGDGSEVAAKDDDHGSAHRRHRRKAKHRHQTGNDKDNRKAKRKGQGKGKRRKKGNGQNPQPGSAQQPTCVPESQAQTCAGQCAQVRNNCGASVNCGSCACEPLCPVCQTCDAGSGQCVPNLAEIGHECATCHTCDRDGQCTSVADNTACDDGDPCTTNNVCSSGKCAGTAVVCEALDQCHDAGRCDAATGRCSNPKKVDGTTCDDGKACTTNDVCTNGVCAGTAVVCPAGVCQNPGTCNAADGTCSNPTNKTNGAACPNGGVCCNGACCTGCCAADGSCGACLVFVTSTRHTGNLGGLSGADRICRDLATNASTPLPGSYTAWLSVGTTPGTSPANGRFRQSALGYQRVDGVTVADSWTDLTDGTIDNPIDVTETGATVLSGYVWTNTGANGLATISGQDCDGWRDNAVHKNGAAGSMSDTDSYWSYAPQPNCSTSARLYCFQQR